jgi:type IV pilus assembly protein PilW
MGGIPTLITAAPTGNDVPVENSLGCQAGDVTLAITGTNCDMSIASAVPDTTTITLKELAGAVAGAHLSCLGTWNEVTYSVNNGNLERDGEPTVSGIVNLQAQYGVSATADSNQVTAWVNPTGATWAAPTVADRNRIKAVRIAIVARNAKTETDAVTTRCTTTKGTVNDGPCAWEDGDVDAAPAINLVDDADGTSWQRYRYRVFETIVPLRNVIWSRDVL